MIRFNIKLAVTLVALLLIGCVSIGHKIDQLPIGATSDEVDQMLKEASYNVIERKNEPDGFVEVRRYRVKDEISYNYHDSRQWDLTFKDGKLISWKYLGKNIEGNASRKDEGMGFLCKDAISRGDKGGIFVHCN